MSETLHIPESVSKKERYESLLPQVRALTDGETDLIANLSNVVAALKYGMDFFWVGIYFAKGEELVLGPFQGPIACTRIAKGRGVCGKAWETGQAIVVEDVDEFPGHIACSAETRSEIVLPVKNDKGDVTMILDIDSNKLATFDDEDLEQLTSLCNHLATLA